MANLPADQQRQNALRRVRAQAQRAERHANAWDSAANRVERLVIHSDDPDLIACLRHLVTLARREAVLHRVEADRHAERAEGIAQRLGVTTVSPPC